MENFIQILVYAFLLLTGRCIGVLIHELGHVVVFSLQNIKIRAVYIFQFAWLKNKGWRLVVCKNDTTKRGGLVIPDLDEITCQEEWDNIRKRYYSGILGGVYSSVLITAMLAPIIFLSTSSYLRFLVFIIIFYSVLIVVFSVSENEEGMGDICAYRWLKQKELHLASEIYENLLLSTNAVEKLKKSIFLKKRIHYLLMDEQEEYVDNNLIYNLIDYEITLVMSGVYHKLDSSIYDRAMSCINQASKLLDQANNESSIILLSHCVEYLVFLKRENEAKQLYEIIKNYEEVGNLVFQYYKRQMRHILRIENETQYLYRKENIQTSSNYKVYTIFPIYYEIEKRINLLWR